jgi:dGTPase
VLRQLLAGAGGFDHNRQTLRIVERLEERYAAFPGLNLSWEVREGIAKHSGPIDPLAAPEFAEYAPELEPPLEAQMIDVVDEIAYNHHDIDDGLSSGLLDLDALAADVPLVGDAVERSRRRLARAGGRLVTADALRGVIDRLVSDLVETTRQTIEAAGIRSADDARTQGRPLVGLSPEVAARNRELKAYLHDHLYRHHRIERMMDKARRVLRALFERYRENPRLLPADAMRRAEGEPLERAIADYLAGMTDRFAIEEHRRLFDPAVRV